MRKLMLLLLLQSACWVISAQLYQTRNGFTGFYSKTPLEDIVAENNQVYAVMNTSKQTVAFSMLVKSFRFKKELMQEHFNENYAESDKYPKATFTGSFSEPIDASKDGHTTLHVNGTITFHGVSKQVATTADAEVKSGAINTYASFTLLPGDFNISIPSLVKDKIAKEIQVKIKASLQSSKP